MSGIAVLTRNDAENVNALRRTQYSSAKGFHVSNEGIYWNRSDDQSVVLGVVDRHRIVSTMRMEIIDSQELVEKKIECPWEFDVELKFPVLVLSKAATLGEYRGQGHNAVLRFWAFMLAKKWGVKQAIGTFVADSPRVRTMEKMGYEFFENRLGWNQIDYYSTQPVSVAVLDLETQFEKALSVLRGVAGEAIQKNPWITDPPEMKKVTVVK